MFSKASASPVGPMTKQITAERDAQYLKRGFVNVLDYGALGDDSTDDTAAIKTAIATGRDVFFPEDKTFRANSDCFIPAVNGQKFFGGGEIKVTVAEASHYGASDRTTGTHAIIFDVYNKDDIVIDGLTLSWYPPSGTATANRLYGVTTQDADNVKIINCKFRGAITPCHMWKNSTRVMFSNNDCVSPGTALFEGAFGIATGGDWTGGVNGAVEEFVISNNHFEGYVSEGVDINWDSHNGLIVNNILKNNVQRTDSEDEEIDIGGGGNGFQCHDILVAGNVIENTTATMLKGLIGLKANPDADYGSYNIVISNNVMTGNDHNDGYGVRAASGYNIIVEGNIMREVGAGIRFETQNIDRAIARNNLIEHGSAATQYGIVLGNTTTNCSAVGNTMKGGIGIRVSATSLRAKVCDNSILDSGDKGIHVEAPGTIVANNRIDNATGHGIDMTAGADYCQILGNIVRNGSANAMTVRGNDNCVISNNICYDDQGTKTQTWGLVITAACDKCVIQGNHFTDNLTGSVSGSGNLTNSVYADNV